MEERRFGQPLPLGQPFGQAGRCPEGLLQVESGPGSGWVESAPSRHTQRMYSTECVEQVARVLTRLPGRVGAPGWGVGLLQEELVLCRVWAPGRGLPEKESRNVSGVAGVTHGMLGGGRVSHPCEGSPVPVGKESWGS